MAQVEPLVEAPWQGIGYDVSGFALLDQILHKAHLDWEVDKVQPYYPWGSGILELSKQALIRLKDGFELSIVSDDWEHCQNRDFFQFITDFAKEGGMSLHTAAAIREGRMVWGLVKTQISFDVNGDLVELHLLFSLPHEYGRAINVRLMPLRVISNSFMPLSLAGNKDLELKITHRQRFDAKIVKETLSAVEREADTYMNMARVMSSHKYNDDNVRQYFMRIFPTSSKSKKMHDNAQLCLDVMSIQPGSEFSEGSWWQAFNAVVYIINHQLSSGETRLDSAWYGENRSKMRLARDLAVEFAEGIW